MRRGPAGGRMLPDWLLAPLGLVYVTVTWAGTLLARILGRD